jgi:BASS family bile acid:Na+ symporter
MVNLLHIIQKLSAFGFIVSSMLGMGLCLSLSAILRPLRDMRFVLRALILNFVFAPALAWLLIVIIPLQPGYAVGLLLIGGAAGAPFLPSLAKTARADLALSVALMALLTIGTLLFMPFALPFMISGLQADPWSVERPLILFIVSPLLIGMMTAALVPSVASRAAPILIQIGNAFLLLLFVLLIVLNIRALLGVVGSGAMATVVLYVSGLFVAGWMFGGAKPKVRGVLGLGTAARNFGAALVPASTNFRDPAVSIMLIVSAIACLVVSFIAARWLRQRTLPTPELQTNTAPELKDGNCIGDVRM